MDGAGGNALPMSRVRAVVRADRGCEDDEGLRRGLKVVIEPALADQKVDDPRKLRVDRDELGPIAAGSPRGDAHDRNVLGDVRGSRGISLDDDHVRGLILIGEVEP